MMIELRTASPWLGAILASLLLAGCGGGDDETTASSVAPEPAPEQAAPPAAPEPEPVASQPEPEPEPEPTTAEPVAEAAATSAVVIRDDGVAEVTIGSTDQMQFTVREFSVAAGQQVELTLVHEGSLPIQVMGHNVVILPAGGDYIAFSREVMSGGGTVENDYIPEGMREGLVAYTDLIGGGDQVTISFTAPDAPGDYPYLCSFPGHFGVMNGIMKVL